MDESSAIEIQHFVLLGEVNSRFWFGFNKYKTPN
jgi:hypothetical protein